ncbi:hypothetical protein M9H77_11273 [Catharanthus roseus]|uniref:Uncharacterized protein n=2 Tax=Catharanthus roseus TaxID=4058 RepID=A0ACC0BE16_CATRO|nr:hypothetical protein M9H77_30306 [Catharanthus roseus]KAI5670909.1 hypothetical protein M9H77_11273 [Catharanthus roseus]
MENCEKMVVVSSIDVESLNCDAFNPSLCEDGVLTLFFPICCFCKFCVVVYMSIMEISNEILLIGIVVASKIGPLSLYNDYACRLAFCVCKGKQKFKARSSTKYLKQFYCYKQGKKCDKGKGKRSYTKVDIRTDCKAMIEFSISDKYLLKRWTNDIALSRGSSRVSNAEKFNKKHIASSIFKFDSASELKVNARECVEEKFRTMKDKIIAEVGPYYIDNLEYEGGSSNIKIQLIGERNYNQAKRKRKSVLTHASRVKMVVQLSMNNEALGRGANALSSESEFSLGISNCRDVEPSSTFQTFINFM